MKKTILIMLLSLASYGLFSMSAGTGFSVFVPESLYLHGEGSVSLEQSLEFSIGLNDYISFPLGVTYNTNYGLTVDGVSQAESPWFYSDSLMPYVMVKAHIPIGSFYVEAFGGVAANYNFTLRAIEGNIEGDLSQGSNQFVIDDGSLDFDKLMGFGYLVGGSFGLTFGDISVDISAQYRNIRHDLNFSLREDASSQVSPGAYYDPDAKLMMRGFSVGIGGSFSF